METKQQTLSQAEQELSVIRKIMDDSRNIVADNGWHYIYWAIIVTVALIVNYIMIITNVSGNKQGMLWFIMMPSAAIIESIIEKKRESKIRVKTFAGNLLKSLWGAAGICMFMFGFTGTITGAYNPVFIFPLISVVLGLAYFVSGAIQQIKWLGMMAIGWWAGAVFLFAIPGIHSLLVFAGMIVLFQLVPGLALWKRAKIITHCGKLNDRF